MNYNAYSEEMVLDGVKKSLIFNISILYKRKKIWACTRG